MPAKNPNALITTGEVRRITRDETAMRYALYAVQIAAGDRPPNGLAMKSSGVRYRDMPATEYADIEAVMDKLLDGVRAKAVNDHKAAKKARKAAKLAA